MGHVTITPQTIRVQLGEVAFDRIYSDCIMQRVFFYTFTILGFIMAAQNPACADYVIWEQPPDHASASNPATINSEFAIGSGFDMWSSYQVSEVAFSQIAIVSDVAVFYTNDKGFLEDVTHARLNVFSPPFSDLYDPTLGTVVPVSVSLDDGFWKVSATNLDILLPNNSYYFGLTPIFDDPSKEEFLLGTTASILDPNYFRNPGGARGFGTDWIFANEIGATTDGAIRIRGRILNNLPEPSGCAVFIVVVGLMVFKRKRC